MLNRIIQELGLRVIAVCGSKDARVMADVITVASGAMCNKQLSPDVLSPVHHLNPSLQLQSIRTLVSMCETRPTIFTMGKPCGSILQSKCCTGSDAEQLGASYGAHTAASQGLCYNTSNRYVGFKIMVNGCRRDPDGDNVM